MTKEDCISRQAAIKAFTVNNKGKRIPYVDCDNFPIEFPLEYIVKTIKELPSADRPQGEWIYGEHDVAMCDGYRCNRCDFFVPWDYEHKFIDFINDYHYCPSCGAKMKGADDE